MRKNIKITILSLVLPAAFAGCSKEMTMNRPPEAQDHVSSKIINAPVDAAEGSLLVFLDKDAAESAFAGMVPSGIDSLLASVGATSFERLIPYCSEDEEAIRRYGLDRWFLVRYDPTAGTESVALRFAASGMVRKVQYNTKMRRASDACSWQYVSKAAGNVVPMAPAVDFDDPMLPDQWHYINSGDMSLSVNARAGADVNVRDAWRLTGGDRRVIVAVLDEGVDCTHEDLEANIWTNPAEIPGNGEDEDGHGYADDIHGFNFVTNTGTITWNRPGDSGHATHVAGTIAAVNNNATGVCGIAGGTGNGDGVRIMSCQIFDGNDGGTSDISAQAIIYAARMGASIIQCSFGSQAGTVTNDADYKSRGNGVEANALDFFLDNAESCDAIEGKGGIAIFASGNESTAMAAYPGAYKRVVSVTATGCDGLPANYTNYGYGCDIAAPGGEYYTGSTYSESTCILSTMPMQPIDEVDASGNPTGSQTVSKYGYMQGTSMACPHVSGVAALGLSYALKCGKSFTREEFVSLLLTSVNDIDHLLAGTKRTMYNGSIGQMPLSPFKGNMGSGTVDAWRLLMQIEGTPVIPLKVGESQNVGLEPYFGGGASSILINASADAMQIDISEEDAAAIGLTTMPYIRYGRLYIHPTKTGSAKFTVTAFVGGTDEDATSTPSAERVTREISVIARNVATGNGGWL